MLDKSRGPFLIVAEWEKPAGVGNTQKVERRRIGTVTHEVIHDLAVSYRQ